MKLSRARILVILLLLVFAFVGGWILLYPSPDRRNIKYVLWKAGLYRLNLGEAEGEMISDPTRDRLVIGKTKAQLERKFGHLVPLANAPEYAKFCCRDGSDCDGALFIADGPEPWMIVFRGDKAAGLYLIKGC